MNLQCNRLSNLSIVVALTAVALLVIVLGLQAPTLAYAFSGQGRAAALQRSSLNKVDAEGVGLVIVPATATVESGQVFSMAVQVQAGAQQVNGASAYLDFDPQRVRVQQLTAGAALPVGLTNKFSNTVGTINFSAGAFSDFPAGTFTLVTIEFEALLPTSGTELAFHADALRRSDVTFGIESVLSGTTNGTIIIGPMVLTVGKAGSGSGTVSLNPDQANYPIGTVVTLTAVPSDTSVFAGWNGSVTGLANPVTVTMTADKAVTATFTIKAVYTDPVTDHWYPFDGGCGGVYFTRTGSIDAITLTARYGYPGNMGGGLPRRYDIEQHGGEAYQAQVQFCYDHADLDATGIPLGSEDALHAYHYSAGSWVEHSSVDAVSNTVTAGPITALDGAWGLGILGDEPTAVTLQDLSASAHCDSNGRLSFAVLFALLGLGAAQFTRRVKTRP